MSSFERRARPSADKPAPSQGPVVQRKGNGLRGLDFDAQLAALSPVQMSGGGGGVDVHAAASAGVQTAASALPHLDPIQRSFGRHDVSGVQSHVSSEATQAMGAEAYASGNHVVFGGGASLHTAAHEAAHVVQQRAGVQLSGGVGQAGDAYERHADQVADAVVQGKSAESLLDGMSGMSDGSGGAAVQMKSVKEARVDARALDTYKKKSAEFESGLGRRLDADPAAHAGVDLLLAKVQQIADAWAETTGRDKAHVYEKSFGWKGGDKYYGAFKMTADNIKDVFANASTAPLRTKLKIVYNAVRNNNLAKWLKVASLQLDGYVDVATISHHGPQMEGGMLTPHDIDKPSPEFATKSGLDKVLKGQKQTEMLDIAEKEKQNVPVVGLNTVMHDHGDVGRSKAMDWHSDTLKASRDREGGKNSALPIDKQQTLKRGDVDLTDPEIDQIHQNEGVDLSLVPQSDKVRETYKGKKDDQVPWEQGTEYYDVIPNSATDKESDLIKARLQAGVSGSTDLMMHAAQHLDVGTDDQLKLRLAMLGWMLPNNDHSFWEIMKAAESYGLAFETTPNEPGREYEAAANFTPVDPKSFKDILGEFPRYYLDTDYKASIHDDVDETVAHTDHATGNEVVQQGTRTISAVLWSLMRAGMHTQPNKLQQNHLCRLDDALLANDLPAAAQAALALMRAGYDGRAAGQKLAQTHGQQALAQQFDAQFDDGEKDHFKAGHFVGRLPATIVDQLDVDGLAFLELLDEEVKAATLVKVVDKNTSDANGIATRKLQNGTAYLETMHRVPAHGDWLLWQLVRQHHGADVIGNASDKLKSAVTDVDAAPLNQADELENTCGVPKTLVDKLRPEPKAVQDAWTLHQFVKHLPFDTKPMPNAQVNEKLFLQIREAREYNNLAIFIGRSVDLLVDALAAQRSPALAHTAWNIGAFSKTAGDLVAEGVPETMASRASHPDPGNDLMKLVRDVKVEAQGKTLDDNFLNLSLTTYEAQRLTGFNVFTTHELMTMMAHIATLAGHVWQTPANKTYSDLGEYMKGGAVRNDLEPNKLAGSMARAQVEQNKKTAKQDKVAADDLSDEEVWGINSYSKLGGMGDWQAALAGKDPTNKTEKGMGNRKVGPGIKACMSGLSKLPAYGGTVYNGQAFDATQMGAVDWAKQQYAPGTIIRRDNVLSAAKSVDASFISKKGYDLAWVISGIKTGKDIQMMSTNYGEEEVLFAPGARLVVVSVEDRTAMKVGDTLDGKFVVHLKEV